MTINVSKCVAYLRTIGVEISDAQAAAWDNAERVTRFLKSERRVIIAGMTVVCTEGHAWNYVVDRRKRKQPDGPYTRSCVNCPACGADFRVFHTRWTEARDGTLLDYRMGDDRWKPIHDQVADDKETQWGQRVDDG